MKLKFHHTVLVWSLIAFLAGIFQISAAFAANEGPPIVISEADMDQQNPDVVALPDKGLWFVVWEDWRTAADPQSTNTGADVWGRFVDGDGSLCGTPFLISDNDTNGEGDLGNQTFPSVAYDQGDGLLLVAWQDTRATKGTESTNIYARGINVTDCSNCIMLDEQTMTYNPVFVESNLLSRSRPRVAYDSTRDYFWLAWSEGRSARKTVKGYAFECTSPSTLFGWTVGDTSFVGYAALGSNPSGTMLPEKVIPDIPHTGDTINIRLMSYGIGPTEETITYEFYDNVNNVDLAVDPSSGEVLLVWEGIERILTVTNASLEADWCPTSGSFDCGCDPIQTTSKVEDAHGGLVHIYGIHYKEMLLSEIHSLLVSDPESLAYMPSVKADPVTGRFLTAWEDLRDGPLYTKIYGQLVYAGGGSYNTNFIIGYQDTNGDGEIDEPLRVSRQTSPSVGYDHTNQRFFTAWQDGRNGSVSVENLDIYGQYVDAEGSLRGSNYLLSCSSRGSPAEGNQYLPAIAFNMGNQLFLAVWKDARNYASTRRSDIYGQRFTIGQPQLTLLNMDNSILSPALIDFGSRLVGEEASASFKVRNTGDVNLDLQNFLAFDNNSTFQYVGMPEEMSDGDQDGITLVPSGEFTVTVKFSPTSAGSFHGDILISSNAGEAVIHLQGLGLEQDPTTSSVSVNPSEISFGSVAAGDVVYQNIVMENDGNTEVNLVEVEEPSAPFSILGGPSPGAFAPGSSLNFTIKFAPETTGTYTSRIVYIFQETNPVLIEISGECSATTDPPFINLSTSFIDFGTIDMELTKSINVQVTNSGGQTAEVLSINLPTEGFDISNFTVGQGIAPGESGDLVISFSPTEAKEYQGSVDILFAHLTNSVQIEVSGEGYDPANAVTPGPGPGPGLVKVVVLPGELQFYVAQEQLTNPAPITVWVNSFAADDGCATTTFSQEQENVEFSWIASKSAQWIILNGNPDSIVKNTHGNGSFTVGVDINQLLANQNIYEGNVTIYDGNVTVTLSDDAHTIPVRVYVNALREAAEKSLATTDWLDLVMNVPVTEDISGALYVLAEHPSLAPGQVFAYRWDSENGMRFDLFSQWGHPVEGAERMFYAADVQNTPIAIPFSSDEGIGDPVIPYAPTDVTGSDQALNIKAFIPISFGGGLRLIGMEGDWIVRAIVGDSSDIYNWSSWRELLYYVLHIRPITGTWVVTEKFGGESYTYIDDTGTIYPMILHEERGNLSGVWSSPVAQTFLTVTYANSTDQICDTFAIQGHRLVVSSCVQSGGYEIYFVEPSIWGNVEYLYKLTKLEPTAAGYLEGTWQYRFAGQADWYVPQDFSAVRLEVVVPLNPSCNCYLVNGTVNGYATGFIVDTGASTVVLNTNDAKYMGFVDENRELTLESECQASTITGVGGTSTGYLCNADVEIEGRLYRQNVQVFFTDGWTGPALLGMSFLDQFHISTSSEDGTMIIVP